MLSEDAKAAKRARGRILLKEAVDNRRELPGKVFSEEWTVFRFFDADLLSSDVGITAMRSLLSVEGAAVVCITNIDLSKVAKHLAYRYLDMDTTTEDFLRLLGGNAPDGGWVTSLPRLGCISDQGRWCIYYDGQAELGILAFKSASEQDLFSSACTTLDALPLSVALEEARSYAFEHMLPDWREALAKSYPEL